MQAVRSINNKSNQLKVKFDDLRVIDPLTDNQKKFFNIYDRSSIMVLHGCAGTGKTFISLYKAFLDIFSKNNRYKKVVIIRSAVPSRDIGFLPGDEEEKSDAYQKPYVNICNELFNKPDAYQRLKEQHMIEFELTSYLRGTTFNNSILVVDELQNMNFAELNTIMTRVGANTKIVFCGDFRQTDLNKKNDTSGLSKFIDICKLMRSYKNVEFDVDDIVRSSIVKEFIIATLDYEDRTVGK